MKLWHWSKIVAKNSRILDTKETPRKPQRLWAVSLIENVIKMYYFGVKVRGINSGNNLKEFSKSWCWYNTSWTTKQKSQIQLSNIKFLNRYPNSKENLIFATFHIYFLQIFKFQKFQVNIQKPSRQTNDKLNKLSI